MPAIPIPKVIPRPRIGTDTGLDAWDGAAWQPITAAWVWDGTAWQPVKSYKVWDGGAWKLAWTHPIASASISLSKTPVNTSEAYSVTLTMPEGSPEGATIELKRDTTVVQTYTPTAGTTTITLTNQSHAGAGDYTWTARCLTAGAETIVTGPTQSVISTPTEVTLNGGHCHDIQAAMTSAASQGLTLRLTGTFYLYIDVLIPDNLYINATGAMFYLNSNSAVENATFNAGRFKNDTKGNAPEYGQASWFTWDGGTLDGNGDGIMTFSHSEGYTVKNATFYNYCATGNTGHALEMNSSGGYDNKTGPYTVQILNNFFWGTNRGQRANSNDEPLQFDWNWDGPSGGSGSSPPLWYPGDPVSEYNQVMCHNVLIQGNTFTRRNSGYAYALCAIGGHDSADAEVTPSYRHNHFLIKDNVITGAVGSTGTNPDKGAIHLFRVRQAMVQDNSLTGGVQNRYITGENATDVTYCSASGNTSASPALTNNNTIVVQNT